MTELQKIDLKKDLKHLYNPAKNKIEVMDVSPLQFLMIDGAGDPNTSTAYKDAVSALFSLAYTLKFAVKKGQGIDYAVMPLEGLWWGENMAQFSTDRKDDWLWTMMILQPDFITEDMVEAARETATKKKDLPALSGVRLETFHEGLCQLLHIGAYADEAPNIARMHRHIQESGDQLRGKHHEIYLSDPNRVAPEKMKTILRQPFARA